MNLTNHSPKIRTPAPPLTRRGSALVAVVIVFALMALVATAVVMSGARESDLSALQVQGDRAQRAAETAANIAVKELMDDADHDGDGAIGSISNDNNTATDPTINSGTRMWATKALSGNITTVTARSESDDARRAVQVVLSGSTSSPSVAGTILLVVVDSASLDAQESAKRTLMQGWGYTVVPISATASQETFDTEARTSSCAYISETVLSTDVGTKLTAATIGVITEESSLSDELGMSSTMTTFSDTQIDVANTTHYITSTLIAGTNIIFSTGQPVRCLSGTLGGITTLGMQVATANPTLAVMERGDTLTPSGTAAGRRVYLPFGNTGFNVNDLNANGLTIMQRSIEWCLLPVSHWKMDDASGSTATDSVGSNHGTLAFASWTTGKVNGGVQCSSVGSYVEVPNSTSLQMTAALSACAWVLGDATSSWPTGSVTSPIIRKGTSEPSNYAVQIADGKLAMYLDAGDTAGIRGNTVLSVGQWYHMAATWDGATVRLYVNGVLDNTPAGRAAPIGTDTRVLNIGGRSGGEQFNGRLDDVRFYNRCLTAAEIAVLAASTKPKITSWTQVSP